MQAYCEIVGDIGVRIRKVEGKDDSSVHQLWLSERRTGLDPRVGEGVNLAVFLLATAICTKSEFPKGNTVTARWASLFKTRPRCSLLSTVPVAQ